MTRADCALQSFEIIIVGLRPAISNKQHSLVLSIKRFSYGSENNAYTVEHYMGAFKELSYGFCHKFLFLKLLYFYVSVTIICAQVRFLSSVVILRGTVKRLLEGGMSNFLSFFPVLMSALREGSCNSTHL